MKQWAIAAALLAAGVCGGKTPEAASSAVAAPAEAGKPIELGRSYTIDSRVLGEARTLNIYTPPGYGRGDTKYPVLYLLDGGVEQDFVHIAGLSYHAWISDSFQPMIVVGIETKDRRRELPFRATSDQTLVKEYPTHGESATFRDYIATEVKPWVEDRYATNGRDVLMGESLAGLFVVETFLRQPALFDGYAAIDPSLWWDHEALGKASPGLFAAHSGGARAVFMAAADEGPEMRAGQDLVAKALRTSPPPGFSFTYAPMEDERHATIYHRAALDALRLLFAKPPEAPAN